MAFYNLFRNEANYETYQDGDWVFTEGQPGDVMYVVKQGRVDIVFEDNVIETVNAGDILGEMALIGNNIRSANAVARGECQLVPIDEKRFNFLVQQTPGFAINVMKIMADRLRRRTA